MIFSKRKSVRDPGRHVTPSLVFPLNFSLIFEAHGFYRLEFIEPTPCARIIEWSHFTPIFVAKMPTLVSRSPEYTPLKVPKHVSGN